MHATYLHYNHEGPYTNYASIIVSWPQYVQASDYNLVYSFEPLKILPATARCSRISPSPRDFVPFHVQYCAVHRYAHNCAGYLVMLPRSAISSCLVSVLFTHHTHFSAGMIRHSAPGFMLISLVVFRPKCRPTPWLKTNVPPAFADASSMGNKAIEISMFIWLGTLPGLTFFSVLRLQYQL